MNELIGKLHPLQNVELWAEFDVAEDRHVVVLDRRQGKESFLVVRFAAKAWHTVAEGTDAAVPQLASALVALSEQMQRASMRDVFVGAGVEVGPVMQRRERTLGDSRDHMTIALPANLPETDVWRLADELEQRLATGALGEVTGSGKGMLGWTVDVATERHERCLAEIGTMFEHYGVTFRVL